LPTLSKTLYTNVVKFSASTSENIKFVWIHCHLQNGVYIVHLLCKKKFKQQPSVDKTMASVFGVKRGSCLWAFWRKLPQSTQSDTWNFKKLLNASIAFFLTEIWKMSFMTMPGLTPSFTLLRQSKKLDGLFFPILLTAKIWHLWLPPVWPCKRGTTWTTFLQMTTNWNKVFVMYS
jgi:hypothetical protein